MFEVYASIAFFFVASVVVMRAGLYLPAFFFLCYMLPFLPVMPAIYSDTAHFWTSEAFSYDVRSVEVAAISAVWLASSLGCIFGFLLQKASWFGSWNIQKGRKFRSSNDVVQKNFRLFLIFVLVALFIVSRIIIKGDAGGGLVHGGEMVICICLLLIILVIRHKYNILFIVPAVCLVCFYLFAQIIYGDRDFFTIFVALMLLFFAKRLNGFAGMLKAATVGILVVGLGALISMLRMSVDVSLAEFIAYFYYNSWTATIQPVLLMIQSEWVTGPTLFGKSYLDLVASVVPSAVYSIFDLQKPISSDNPALWFYIEGMGGMHAAGVAWRNFGVTGVFLQCLAAVVFLAKIEKLMLFHRSFWSQFFYLVVASQLMHTVWYSLVSMVNALVLFVAIYLFFNFEVLFFLQRRRSTAL